MYKIDKLIIQCLLFFIAINYSCFAQNVKINEDVKIEFDIEGKQLWYFKTINNDFHLDPILHRHYSYSPAGETSDNPFLHSAVYGILSSKINYRNKYKLYFNIIGEQRGWSLGTNYTGSNIFIPQFKLIIEDTLKICNQNVSFSGHLGDIPQARVGNGLKFYNVDIQGLSTSFQWKEIYFKFSSISDLQYGYALYIQEAQNYSIGYSNIKSSENKGIDIGVILSHIRQGHSIKKEYVEYGSVLKYQFNDRNNLYVQAGLKNSPYINVSDNSAILIGGNIKIIHNKYTLKFNPEFRYYGKKYNESHYNRDQLFRGDPDPVRPSSIGKYLYPLKDYYYPISQWAIYTEYRARYVLGTELRIDLQHNIKNRLKANLNVENLWIVSGFEKISDHFFYCFYTYYIYWELFKNVKLGLYITNKIMNLDLPYKTSYMAKYPFIGVHFHKKLTENW